MNNEIKEILEQLEWYREIGKKGVYYPECVLPNKKAFILLDYITNLQQDTEMYAQLKDEYEEEIKELHENNQNMQEEMARVWEENERLKQNQVKALNRIRDFINLSKCEITEGSYSNDKHSQYWSMFKRFAEELQDKIKGIDTKDYVYIPKWREQELLNQEEQLEDYKSRCEKAIEYVKNNSLYTEDYDYDEEENLRWLGAYDYKESEDLLNILQNGSDSQ